MLKVSHFITTIERGGAENQLLILVQEQRRLGYQVTVIPLKGKCELIEDFESAGATVDLSILNLNPVLQFLWMSFRRKKNNEIMHAHLPRAELLCSMASSSRFVISRHNAEAFFPSAPKFISSLLSRFVTSRSRLVIAISDSVSNFLIKNNEVSRISTIKTIYYGIDLTPYDQKIERIDIKERHKILKNTILFGTISRLTEQKDIPTLLKAFKLTNEVCPDSHLLIIGVGHLENDLRKLAETLGLDSHITWVGKTNEIIDYLAAFDVFVLTSRYEGFGLVLLEAMAACLPIVASSSEAALEVLGDSAGQTFMVGDYEELSQNLIHLASKGSRALDGISSRARASHFDSRRMAIEIDGVYRSHVIH